MCSVQDSNEEMYTSADSTDILKSAKKQLLKSSCKRCEEQAVVVLQKKDPLCKSCFMIYCNHKFRSTIGKSKKLKSGDSVLLAFSGGSCSEALLHMVQETLKDASHKKLLFSPGLLYIDESSVINSSTEDLDKNLEETFLRLKTLEYPLYMTSLEMAYRNTNHSDFYWKSFSFKKPLPSSEDLRQKLNQSLSSFRSLSAKEDYLKYLRMKLITDIAKHAGFMKVFVGDTATNLAIRLLSDIVQGRGSQIPQDTGFMDNRYEVPVCRPLREFLNKEISMYNHFNSIMYTVQPTLSTKTNSQASVQRLTETFVCGLQENFPATISTIFRTGEKLASAVSDTAKENNCVLCQSRLDNMNPDLCSALEALLISARLSKETNVVENTAQDKNVYITDKSHCLCKSQKNKEMEKQVCHQDSVLCNKSSFFNSLCHGCQIVLDEMMELNHLPPLFVDEIKKHITRSRMKEEIKDFLLEECD